MVVQRVPTANKGKMTMNLLTQRLKSIAKFASCVICFKTLGQQQTASDVFPIKSQMLPPNVQHTTVYCHKSAKTCVNICHVSH